VVSRRTSGQLRDESLMELQVLICARAAYLIDHHHTITHLLIIPKSFMKYAHIC
jgi:hypothetical protein